ncbi:hypothetical protein [Klebsiella oxytoca]|uniref:hypothetical protein n=1 Tax=Klebsiella oxytoca TaxID=571 RepID=UPI00298481C3|nr:hypothetical protein [Klebsiella oxytoca]MEB2853787.1 hypothetical protein [Klebsiella oxytoca]MEB2880223.1 hypothetical protein [Klebsiella oxytoca]HEG4357236.1 hypothetical protein [Klebsiella oxytoca]HEG4387853.1 hypothetical protein [Klebsiella oxytoca]
MTSKLTRERIQEIINLACKTCSDGSTIYPKAYSTVDSKEIVGLARMALAAMDCEPVADIVAWSHPTEERTCDIRWRRHDVEPGPLYRHAQMVPSVMDFKKMARELVENLVDCDGADEAAVRQYLEWTESYCRDAIITVAVKQF